MARNASYLFVGTSTGALVVFQHTNATLLPCLKIQYQCAVTSIFCKPDDPPKGALIVLANGWEDLILYTNTGFMESKGATEMHELLKDIKWRWIDVSPGRKVLSLSKDGILCRTTTPQSKPPYIMSSVRSIDLPKAQRYSHLKNIYVEGGHELAGLVAGYYDGMILFAVYGKGLKGWKYFTVDCIHHHEIIDSIFYETPSKSGSIWSLATLDKAGLYVQRAMICDKRGIKLLGLPMKWYCPVRNPKAMVLLEKKKEVIVVGRGLATLVLKSLAPPPPSPTSATDCDGLFCDRPLD